MTSADFFANYSDEESCKSYFKSQRQLEHNVCKQCGSLHTYWQSKENRWRCKECKHAMGLKNGTVMENSNLSYKVWLWSLYFVSLTKKGFSALELQRLVGHKRYEPIWGLMQKIRVTMGHRDEKYTLDGFIEMDEGFFEGLRKKDEEGLITKPAKELDRQVKAIVAVSTTPIVTGEDKKGRPTTKPSVVHVNGLVLTSERFICLHRIWPIGRATAKRWEIMFTKIGKSAAKCLAKSNIFYLEHQVHPDYILNC